MTKIKLKPCPFCKGPAHIFYSTLHWIKCLGCAVGTEAYPTAKQAIKAWNRREK